MFGFFKKRQEQKAVREALRKSIRMGQPYLENTSNGVGKNSGAKKEKRSREQKTQEQETQERKRGREIDQRRGDVRSALYPRAWASLLLIVVALVILAAVSFFSATPGALQLGTQGVIDSFSVSKGSSDDEANLEADVSWKGSFANELPSSFDEEIGLSGDSTTVVSNDGRTIGLSCKGTVDAVLAEIQASLEERGWTYVPSGQSGACTFVKDSGVYQWLAVTCVVVGDEVSVVLVPGEGRINE